MINAFLDTNTFLEYRIIKEIPWQTILGDEYKLVIPITVINELDNHKNSDRKRIRNRAIASLNLIEEVAFNKGDNQILINRKEPSSDKFATNNLDSSVNDDRIILSIVEYQGTTADKCVLITEDTGIKLKAYNKEIGVITLDKKYKLPYQKSEDEKELYNLKAENAKLKTSLPRLTLSLTDGTLFYKRKLYLRKSEIDTQDQLNRIKLEYPKLIHPEDNTHNPIGGLVSRISMFNPTRDQIEKYNSQLDEYYFKYEQYLLDNIENEIRLQNGVFLQLFLNNNGNTPAKNVDLKVSFPDEIRSNIHYETSMRINAPEPPKKPERNFPFSSFENHSVLNMGDFTNLNIDPDEPEIVNNRKEFAVQYNLGKVQHSLRKELHPILIFFKNPYEIRSFNLPYRFVADNHKKVEGKINVIFER